MLPLVSEITNQKVKAALGTDYMYTRDMAKVSMASSGTMEPVEQFLNGTPIQREQLKEQWSLTPFCPTWLGKSPEG